MVYLIAQLSDLHVGGPNEGSGARFSMAIDEINSMSRRPDLVLLTGDLTHDGTDDQWAEFLERIDVLTVAWQAMSGNHDHQIIDLAGHRAIDAGPLRLVLVDTSTNVFGVDDAVWLDNELAAHHGHPTIIAIHHPPFETGIWWMDCVGLQGSERFEAVVRRHPHVLKVLSGHVHRLIQTTWDSCSLWVCPSTAVSVAADLDPGHAPAETAEAPTFSLHAYTGSGIVSHLLPVGAPARRTLIENTGPDFVTWARGVQASRDSLFA